jgi:hypothetical protein
MRWEENWSVKCKECGAHFEVGRACPRAQLPAALRFMCPECRGLGTYQLSELKKTR